LSLNRYHKIETLLFYSDTQLDTAFLIIRCKDSASRTQWNLFQVAKAQPIFRQR